MVRKFVGGALLYPYLLLGIIFLCDAPVLFSQCTVCNKNECGPVFATYSPKGANVFCEGSKVTLINTSTTRDFEVFYIDWGDGKKDTVRNYGDIEHVYTYSSEFKRCESDGNFSQEICYRGEKKCGTNTSCSTTKTYINVKLKPEANIDIQNEYCVRKTVSFKENGCYGSSFLWNFGDAKSSTDKNPVHTYATPGFNNVTLTVSNECGSDTDFRTIRVVDFPKAGFTSEPSKGLCGPDTVRLKMNDDPWGRGRWKIEPIDTFSWKFADTIYSLSSTEVRISLKKTGTFKITHISENDCGTDQKLMEYKVYKPPIIQVDTPKAFCEKGVITEKDLNFFADGDLKSLTWAFEGADRSADSSKTFKALTFLQSGKITMRYQTEVCGSKEFNIPVTIYPKPAISLSGNPEQFCFGADTLALQATPSGGTWSGLGVVHATKGLFFPKNVPENTGIMLLYTIGSKECSSSDSIKIMVIPAPVVSLQTDSFCLSESPKNLVGLPLGGVYAGKGVDPTTGLFSPLVSGAGLIRVTYTLNSQNGCRISAKSLILVDRPPMLNLSDTLTFCKSNQVSQLNIESGIRVDSLGGTFIWKGQGVINQSGAFNPTQLPESQTSKLYVQYIRNGCSVEDSLVARSNTASLLSLSKDTTVCVDLGTYQLNTNLSGGTWTGNGVNISSGLITLSVPNIGEHLYRYEYKPQTSCFQKGEVKLRILNPGLSISAGKRIEICPEKGEILLEGAFPAGGIWNGPGLINATEPLVKTAGLSPGENTFTYCVTDPGNNACQACATKIVFLHPAPVAAFDLPEPICLNVPIKPLNKSKDALTYQWVTEENQISQKKDPTFLFAISGNKNIRLEVQNGRNCTATLEKNFRVITPAGIQISLSQKEACAPFDLGISKVISGDDIAIKWIMGRDTILGPDPPSWTLRGTKKDTIYHIVAIAENKCAVATDVKSINIHPLPKIIFGTFPSEGCSPLSVQLANLSEGGPLRYQWEFGNGNSSPDSLAQLQKFSLSSTDYKEFTIKLRGENACGKDSLEKKIAIYKRDTEAFFEIDSLEGCPPFQLKARSYSSAGASLNWQLRHPDGKISSGNQSLFNQILTFPGEYHLLLGATKCGTDTFETRVKVLPIPDISFNLKESYCLIDTIKATLHPNNPGSISGIYWNFGDGNSSNEYDFRHVYDLPGKFSVSLTAYSAANSCKVHLEKSVLIHPSPDINFLTDKQSGCSPLSVNFQHVKEPLTTYEWNFGNNKTIVGSNPTYLFTPDGVSKVQLTATNSYGCKQTSKPQELIIHPKPVASFSLPVYEFCEFTPLSGLKNHSTGTSNFEWKWLDGIFNDREPALLAFKERGDYELQLTVGNNFGCRDTLKKSVRINTRSIAAFELLSPNICLGNTPVIVNKSKNANRYQWFIGPYEVSNQPTPLFKTTLTGDFPITLITSLDQKCGDTATIKNPIMVFPKPKADFIYRTDFITKTIGEVQFINQSLFSNRYFWDFGDGTTANSLGPLHEYDRNRNIKVKLIAYADYINQLTCSDTITKEIQPEWITTFHAPNALAPESGNPNIQVFKPVGIGLKEYEIQIISPWGERVWFSNELLEDTPADSWNGRKYNIGDLLPQGAYIWQAKITFINGNNRVFTGSVNLLR